MRSTLFAVLAALCPLVATAGEAEAAYEQKDYARCATLYTEAAQTGKQASLNYYNAACCLSLGGKADAAVDALEKSLALEPDGLAEMKKDADLASVVKTPRFAALAKKTAAALAVIQKSQNGPLRDELSKMADADQVLRMKPGNSAEQIMAVDKKNTERMKAIVAKHGWPGIKLVGKHAATAAWLLVQHADADPAFQKLCLEKMTAAAKLHDVDPVNVAYLADRVAAAEGKGQVYGTQFMMEPGQFKPRPIEDEAHVDERRAALGLESMAEYTKVMREKYPEQAAAGAADAGVAKH